VVKASAAQTISFRSYLEFQKTPAFWRLLIACLLLLTCLSRTTEAQTPAYHLDNPSGVSGQWLLSTSNPTGTVWTVKSQSLSGAATGEYFIASFATASGDPGKTGTIPSGSTVTFTVSMQESKNGGTIFPRAKLYLNSASGTLLCIGTGTNAITATATLYTFSCSTTAAITMTSTDGYFLWVGVNMTKAPGGSGITANLQFNGAKGGVTDSTVVAPGPPPPSITSLSPTSGPANTSVTVTGSRFGIPQGTSTIQFNGTTATPFSWSDGTIVVPVPVGATTGAVVVNAGGSNSNGVTFTVTPGPSITGLSSSSGAPGTAVTINGQNFASTQGSSVVRFNGLPATVTSWGANSIGVTVPAGVTTGPVTVTVSGQTSNGVTFTAITSGTLSGTVTSSADGSAISGATVQALQNGTVKASASTASNGSYSIPNLASGNYDVQTSATGFGAALTNSVAVIAGQTATANFSLSSPGTISGKVTQADGVTAIPGAKVQYFVGSASGGNTSTDSAGSYSISGLSTGSYTLEAGANGYVTQSQTINLTGSSTSTSNFLLQAVGAGPINYVYDELGRLVSVIDSSGDTATYRYDAVGNILSISRQNSNKLAIISFTPQSGTAGAAVTINGTGFSTTAAQDSVSFNGVSATVISGTATQINVTVPATASTGPIAVTTAAGSVSSNANFTVLTSSGAPTITGFTPNMGTSGTAVAINGTNFDVAANNDVITLNTSYVAATSATALQINTSVPASTGSGRISVATPAGTATSSQDFYIPFGGHLVGDFGYTGRIAFGTTQTVSLPSSKIAALLFDGTAGQGVSLQLSGSTFSACSISLYAPNQNQLTEKNCTNVNNSVPSISLPSTGTYTIGIDPGSSSGSITISLTQDTTGSITPGTPVNFTTTFPGQGAHYSFQGTSGQVVSAEVAGVSGLSLSILKPDGSTLASTPFTTGTASLVGQRLATTGTYQIAISPSAGMTGSATVSLITQSSNGTIGFNTPVTSTVTASSLIGFSFTGTAGQVVSAEVAGLAGGGFSAYLLNPDGSTLGSACCATNQTNFVGKALSTTGAYQIVIAPNNGVTGSVTVSLDSQTTNGTINFNTPVTTTLSSSTLMGLNFNGTAGQVVSVEAAGLNGNFTVYLVNPDGSTLASGGYSCCSHVLTLVGKTLPSTGTYQIIVAPNNGVSGSVTVSLISQTTDATITFNTPVTSTISSSSLIGLSFSGTAGQIVSVEGAGLNGSFTLYLVNPDGSTLASGNCCGSVLSFVGKTLPSTGTYQIIIAPNSGVSGSMTVSLISQTTDGTITFNTPVTSTISSSSLIGLSFSGTAGQIVSVEAAGLSGTFTLYLVNPDGSTLASGNCCGSVLSFVGKTLPSTGPYQIIIAPDNGVSGSITASLISQTTNGTITFNMPVTSTISSSSLIGLSFSGTAGQVVSLEMAGLGGGAFSFSLLNPDGSTLQSGNVCCGTSQASMYGRTLATSGTYQIVIVPNNGVTGSITVSLISQTTNGTISFGTPVTTSISTTSLIGLSFSGTAGQVVSVEMAGLGGGAFSVVVLNPDGSTLGSGNICCGTNQASIIGKTLATTGTYQIIVLPNNGVTGTATLSLISQTTNGTINFGTPVTSTVGTSSISGLSFSGTAGQTASIQVTPAFSGGGFSVYLLNPDGSTLASTFSTSVVTFSGESLASTGTYQIVIAPNNGVGGSATTSLTSP
jgi:YD repeat-containing protein